VEKFGKSQSVLRQEDDRFLTGRGQYVDDKAPQGALHGYVLRSSYAHGVITALDTQEAEEAMGSISCSLRNG
jgi:carbon-monoxide dehydrogenase large subunit